MVLNDRMLHLDSGAKFHEVAFLIMDPFVGYLV